MTIQKFVHKPEEIVALRFHNNNKEIEEFLEENNEACCMDYEWRFCVHNNEPLLEIREPLPECGVYKIIEVPRGDYISSGENGVIIHLYEEDIKEFYDEVKPDVYKTRHITFDGFDSITSILGELNFKCGYDRYEYHCKLYPTCIEISDDNNGTELAIMEGDMLVIDKDGSLSYIRANGD